MDIERRKTERILQEQRTRRDEAQRAAASLQTSAQDNGNTKDQCQSQQKVCILLDFSIVNRCWVPDFLFLGVEISTGLRRNSINIPNLNFYEKYFR